MLNGLSLAIQVLHKNHGTSITIKLGCVSFLYSTPKTAQNTHRTLTHPFISTFNSDNQRKGDRKIVFGWTIVVVVLGRVTILRCLSYHSTLLYLYRSCYLSGWKTLPYYIHIVGKY